MDHYLIQSIENSLGWTGASGIGKQRAGYITDSGLCVRLQTPTRLLDLLMRRSLSLP